jgi:3-hydroxyisobutyrate dehydrogenase-like beta-hydroxyacid dehydrogenase
VLCGFDHYCAGLNRIVSETPTDANLVKLSGNFLIAAVIESLGEAMALVGKGGIDKRQYLVVSQFDCGN